MLMLRLISLLKAQMKKYLLLLLTGLGLFALVSTNSKAQDFSISFGGVPAFTVPATIVAGIVIPGTDIITTTAVFTIAPHIIRVTTMGDTAAAIIDVIFGKTMINR
jgi:hypothetical protein